MGQSRGWLIKRNSITAFLAATTLSDIVDTTIPSEAAVEQAITNLGIFSTSTRQTRQLPETDNSGCQQKCGIIIPFALAASIIVCPCVNSISFPSNTNFGINYFSIYYAADFKIRSGGLIIILVK